MEVLLIIILIAIIGVIVRAFLDKEEEERLAIIEAKKKQEMRNYEEQKRREKEERERVYLENKLKVEKERREKEEIIIRKVKAKLDDVRQCCEKLGLSYKSEPVEKWQYNWGYFDYKIRYFDYKISITFTEKASLDEIFSLIQKAGIEEFRNNHILIENNKELLSISCYKDHLWFYLIVQFNQETIADKVFKEREFAICLEKGKKYLYCYLNNRRISRKEKYWTSILKEGIEDVGQLPLINDLFVVDSAKEVLVASDYHNLFEKHVDCSFENGMLVLDYNLPSRDNFLSIKKYKYAVSTNEISEQIYTEGFISKTYDNVLYSICLRSIYELFSTDKKCQIKGIVFNGHVSSTNRANGKIEQKCILSVYVKREKFEEIDLVNIDPKICFKSLKGVAAAKLIDVSPIIPILALNKDDRRFINGHNVTVDSGTNLASMDWEDFEHLVRELFEMEYSESGGEVKVTQASRDGGVDAIIFDPDPLRGGKIVIQAKRYTNTVNVSAVRDLYGTVINEGANGGILITTSDYGADSYEFAKNKPLKLLNGGHLLGLLEKHNRKAYINIQEARKSKTNEGNL